MSEPQKTYNLNPEHPHSGSESQETINLNPEDLNTFKAEAFIRALNNQLAQDIPTSCGVSAAVFFLAAVISAVSLSWLWPTYEGGFDPGHIMIILVISVFLAILLAIGVENTLQSRHRHRVYHTLIAPEIDSFLRDYQLQRRDFATLADQVLPKDAPLRLFLFGALPEHDGG
jgi:hypothetical protein